MTNTVIIEYDLQMVQATVSRTDQRKGGHNRAQYEKGLLRTDNPYSMRTGTSENGTGKFSYRTAM